MRGAPEMLVATGARGSFLLRRVACFSIRSPHGGREHEMHSAMRWKKNPRKWAVMVRGKEIKSPATHQNSLGYHVLLRYRIHAVHAVTVERPVQILQADNPSRRQRQGPEGSRDGGVLIAQGCPSSGGFSFESPTARHITLHRLPSTAYL